MIHYMKLDPTPFLQIKNGSKTIELRLWDEKRREIKADDLIVFSCTDGGEQIQARVLKLHKFPDFEALYKALPLEKCGYSSSEVSAASHTDMEAYYTKEQISTYGVVGIELCEVILI